MLEEKNKSDEELHLEVSRILLAGIVIFSAYTLIAGVTVVQDKKIGLSLGVSDELNTLLIVISCISIVIALWKLLLSFENFFSQDLCSLGSGNTFDIIFALVLFVLWVITTGLLTFNGDSPISSVGTGYFSAWAQAMLSGFLLAVSLVNRLDVSNAVWFASSVLFVLGGFSTLVTASAASGCISGDFGPDFCSDGRTIFAFVVGCISIITLVFQWYILKNEVKVAKLSPELVFTYLAAFLVTLWGFAVLFCTFAEPFRVGGIILANGFFGVWGSFIFSCLLMITSHERFTMETRSDIERKSIIYVLFCASVILVVASGVECNSQRCNGFVIWGIIAGTLSALTLALAAYFFRVDGEYNERFYCLVLILWWFIAVLVLTFPFDAPFDVASTGFFSVWTAAIFSLLYINQVTPDENDDHILACCVGPRELVEEKVPERRRKVYMTLIAVIIIFIAVSISCIEGVCTDIHIVLFVFIAITLILLAAIFSIIQRKVLLEYMSYVLAILWLIGVPLFTYVGPFDGQATGNGFFACWATLLGERNRGRGVCLYETDQKA